MTASDKLMTFYKFMTYINNDYRTEHDPFERLTFHFKTFNCTLYTVCVFVYGEKINLMDPYYDLYYVHSPHKYRVV